MKKRNLIVLICLNISLLILSSCGSSTAKDNVKGQSASSEKVSESITEKSTQTVTEKITEKATNAESKTVSTKSNTSITKEQLIGEWKIDADYTMQYNDVSMGELYGSLFSQTENILKFNLDGSFEYYVSWCYGKGSFDLDGNNISFNLDDGNPSSISAIVEAGDVKRIALNQFDDGRLVFWVKK